MGGVTSTIAGVVTAPVKIVTEPIRHIPGVGGVVGGIVDAGSNAITAKIRGVGHLADGNVGGALGVVMNPIAPPPPPSLPSPPPKQVPAGWENAQSFCNLSTTNHGNKDAYDCSAICNSKGKVWAQVHNNTCKCGDADQCFFTRKSEPSSETKMLLVNTPKFQHWLSIQHADIVKKINAIKRPYSNQKVSELDSLITKGYEMGLSSDHLTATENLRALMVAEIAQIAEEARLAEERRLAEEAAAAAAAAQAAANAPPNIPNDNIPNDNIPNANLANPPDANVNEPPSLENTLRGLMGFDATESGDSDNSKLTIMIAGALALGLMLLIIRKKRKSRNNHYAPY